VVAIVVVVVVVVGLHAVLLLELDILLPQSVDTVDHDLNKLDLRVAEPVFVGDVVGVTSLSAGLAAGATGLNGELLAPGLQLVNALLGPAWEVNVDGGPHAGSKVGRAGVDVAVPLVEGKVLAGLGLDAVTDSLDASGQTLEHALNVAALLHRDDPGLVLLIDPEQEGLGLVVEDTAALWPVPLHTSNSEIAVSTHEEEVVIHKLLPDLLVHASEGVVGACQVPGQLGQGAGHQLLNINPLLLGDARGETETINVPSNPDPGGVHWNFRVNVADNLGGIHVRGVLGICGYAMIILDHGIKDLREVLVGVPAASIDTTVLVVKLDCAGDGLGDGEATGLGLDVLDLVPPLLGDVLGHQRVLGLDNREFSRHFEGF